MPRKFTPDHAALYFTDNGCILCGEHLGSSAYHTGYDISGQKIEKVTPDDVRAFVEMVGVPPKCEGDCPKTAALLHSL
jgi:ferredoxin